MRKMTWQTVFANQISGTTFSPLNKARDDP